MDTIMTQIHKADSDQIYLLLEAVHERFRVLFPDWEISTVTIEKSGNQNEDINRILAVWNSVKSICQNKDDQTQSIFPEADLISSIQVKIPLKKTAEKKDKEQ